MPSREHNERTRAKAVRIRTKRSELKRAIKAGDVDWYELTRGNLPEWEPYVEGIRFDRLLLMIPYVGEQTMWELCVELRVRPDTRMSGVTFAKRQELADLTRAMLKGEPVPSRPGLTG